MKQSSPVSAAATAVTWPSYAIDRCREGALSGWVAAGALPEGAVPSVLVDGAPVATVELRATEPGPGPGRRAFAARLPAACCDGGYHFVALRLDDPEMGAVLGDVMPCCLRLDAAGPTEAASTGPVEGGIEVTDAGVVLGWIDPGSLAQDAAEARDLAVAIAADGRVLHRAKARLDGARLRFAWAPAPDELPRTGDVALSASLLDGAGGVRPIGATTWPAARARSAWSDDELFELAAEVERSGSVQEAIALHEAYRARWPQDAWGLVRVARCLMKSGCTDEAARLAADAAALEPANPKVAALRARIAEQDRRFDLALSHWGAVAASARSHPHYQKLVGTAKALIALDRASEALVPMREAVLRQPDQTGVLRDHARLLLELGHEDEARAAFAKLMTVAPDDREASRHLRRGPAPVAPWIAVQRRYRSALRGGSRPVALAMGSGAYDVAMGEALVRALSRHLGCEVRPILSRRPSSELHRVLQHRGCAIMPPGASARAGEDTEPPREVAELLFVLPEYMTETGEAALPAAGLTLGYLDERRMTAGGHDARLAAYATWLGELTGMAPPEPPAPSAHDAGPLRVSLALHLGDREAGAIEAAARKAAPARVADGAGDEPADGPRVLVTDMHDAAVAAALEGCHALLVGAGAEVPAFLANPVRSCPPSRDPAAWVREAVAEIAATHPEPALMAAQ